MKLLRMVRYVILLPLLLLTLAFTPKTADTATAVLTGRNVFVLDDALVMGQGITADGEYYYTSGSIAALKLTALAKFTFDGMAFVQSSVGALPRSLLDRGFEHIGGISVYNGLIYAAIEGKADGRDIAAVAAFSCDTLELAGEVYDLPYEQYEDGIPWLAVDGETGLLYASKWSHAPEVYVYDISAGMALVRVIPVANGELDRIQGGEFYDGTLYLSRDNKEGETKQVLAFDPADGEISVYAERYVGDAQRIEAEGLTVYPAPDGSFLHVLDYNTRVGVFVHHYLPIR
ncbi:MAG: hypothetical protein IK108_07980 [Clostridia bacterium]|nr:hypothetical protein [Clostridia bacterium]